MAEGSIDSSVSSGHIGFIGSGLSFIQRFIQSGVSFSQDHHLVRSVIRSLVSVNPECVNPLCVYSPTPSPHAMAILCRAYSQSTQSDGPVRLLIFCSISIFLLASLVVGKGPQRSAGPL